MQASNQKKQVQVVIGGKVYKLAGSESEEYIQAVAHYINKKLVELSKNSSAGIEFSENYPILLALNIADDLFKEKNKDTAQDGQTSAASDEALADLSDLSNQLVEKTNEIDSLNKTISEKDGIIAKYKAAMQSGSVQFEKFKQAIAERDEEITRLRGKLSVANSDLTAFTTKVSDKDIEIGELNKKIAAKNKELNSLSVKLSEKNSALNELNKKSAERNQKLNSVNKERDELAVKLKEATGEINALKKSGDGTKTELNATIDELNARINSLEGDKSDLTARLEKLNGEYNTLSQSIPQGSAADLQNALNAVRAENQRLYTENEQLLQELNQAKGEIKSFIESLK